MGLIALTAFWVISNIPGSGIFLILERTYYYYSVFHLFLPFSRCNHIDEAWVHIHFILRPCTSRVGNLRTNAVREGNLSGSRGLPLKFKIFVHVYIVHVEMSHSAKRIYLFRNEFTYLLLR